MLFSLNTSCRVMQRLSQFLPRLAQPTLLRLPTAVSLSRRPITCPVYTRLASTGQPLNRNIAQTVSKVSKKTPAPTVDECWEKRSKWALEDAIATPPDDAYAGRSVRNTGNLAYTFRSLSDILIRNKVRHTIRMTERHEKKGAKRRRLQSERWRKQFANEVRKKVQLVMKIRDRGA